MSQPSSPRPDAPKYKDGVLPPHEKYWVDLQPWLLERGYRLRARYQPDWTASWLVEGFSGNPIYCEDYRSPMHPDIMDAVRIKDGALVMMKHIEAARAKKDDSKEVEIAEYLSKNASDSQNRTVPFYEILKPPGEEDDTILVMPLLYEFSEPEFETVGEVVDLLNQLFEGMQFLHRHNIAYRDCKYNNILADSARLYSSACHPLFGAKSYDFKSSVKQKYSRTERPVNYWYIDFGLSRRYSSRTGNVEPSPWGAAIYKVPEFQNVPLDTPCDPFPVDIYFLGMMIRQRFLEEWEWLTPKINLEWLDKLTRDMTVDDPKARPTIEEVVERFKILTKKLGAWKLRAPVYQVKDRPSPTKKVKYWTKQAVRMIRFVPAVPKPPPRIST